MADFCTSVFKRLQKIVQCECSLSVGESAETMLVHRSSATAVTILLDCGEGNVKKCFYLSQPWPSKLVVVKLHHVCSNFDWLVRVMCFIWTLTCSQTCSRWLRRNKVAQIINHGNEKTCGKSVIRAGKVKPYSYFTSPLPR